MRDRIADDIDTPPGASGDVPSTVPPSGAPVALAPAAPAVVCPAGYDVLYEIGEGGMGVVYRATERLLDRPVALKYLQERYAGHPAAAARFQYEARVSARLQHPGIPPVHAVGTLPDGRPFLAMKLIRGRTLDVLLQKQGPGASRWLGVFEAICQALAYAHSEGIIHRDLKPGNVMVGAFGEVQVMDWGLAKTLAERPSAAEATPAEPPPDVEDVPATVAPHADSARSPGADETRQGSVMGTPAYMPPEQARGAIDRVDRRSDVFGLGAILCELLTGGPPYAANDGESTRRLAAEAKLADAFARLDACGADVGLIGLCKRCLSAEPQGRPADASAVAKELAEFRHEQERRLKEAELAEAKAGEKLKRRRVQMALAGVVALLMAVGGGGGSYLKLQRAAQIREHEEREEQLRTAVTVAFAKVGELQRQERWSEAASVLAQTRTQMGDDAPADLLARVDQAIEDVGLVAELDAVRLKGALVFENGVDFAGTDRGYAAVFGRHGLTGEADSTQDVAGRVSVSVVKVPLLAALDDWAFVTKDTQRRAWLMAVARAVDPHPWRDRLRDPAIWADKTKLQSLADEAMRQELSPQAASALGLVLDEKRAVALLLQAQQRHPADFWVNLILGSRLGMAKSESAVGFLRVAVALRQTPSACNNLGNALGSQGQTDEAIAWFRKAMDLDPTQTGVHFNMGNVLQIKGRWGDAADCYERAIAENPKDVSALNNLGNCLFRQGRSVEAIDALQKAIKLDPSLAAAYFNLGRIYKEQGKAAEAAVAFKKGIALQPARIDAQVDLGIVLIRLGQKGEAAACFVEAVRLDPKHAAARSNLGNALREQGRYDEAAVHLREAIILDPTLAMAHNNLGLVLSRQGKASEAVDCYSRAIRLEKDLPEAHCNLGLTLRGLGRFAESLESLRRGHELGKSRRSWPFPSAAWLAEAERLARLEQRLPHLIAGDQLPASLQECFDLVNVCRFKNLLAQAARFSARAFTPRPHLAGDLARGYRYDAACWAALAASGKSADKLGRSDPIALRRQALTWLRADLALWSRLHASGDVGASRVANTLTHWQKDADLAALRDAAALKALSAEEREACERLWADVAALLKKVQTK